MSFKASSQPPPISAHLFPSLLWVLLEGPGDSGLQGFRDTLQECAAALHSVQFPLDHAMLVVVCRGQRKNTPVSELMYPRGTLRVDRS